MFVKSPQADILCIICTGKGNLTFIDHQNFDKHFNDEHDLEFDEDFVANVESKDTIVLESNIKVENMADKIMCVICTSKGSAKFVNKEDTNHFNDEHQCIAYDKDFLIDVNCDESEVNVDDILTVDGKINLDEVTPMEVVDGKSVEEQEIEFKTDEDAIQDALKELFIQEENLRKLTEEVNKSIDIRHSNVKTKTEIKVEKTNVKLERLDPCKKSNKSDVLQIKVPEKDSQQLTKPSKTVKQKFTCDACNQEFAYKGNLKKHMTKIHGEPNVKTLQILKNLPRPIQKHLQERNYQLIQIKGDGHCLFRSLAHGLNMFISSSQPAHLKVRAEIAGEGLKRAAFYSNLATYYLPTEGPAAFQDRMMKVQQVQDSKGPVWGNNVEIIIATQLYQVDIYKLCFIPATGKEYYQVFAASGGGRRAARFLVLLYDISVPGAEHFSLLQSGERPALKQGTPVRCYEEQNDGTGKFTTVRAL